MSIRTLIPVSRDEADLARLAPRPVALEGATLGLYANVKPNADRFLDALEEELTRHYRFARVVRRAEGEIGMGADGPYDELAKESDFVIAGVGD
jgi:hypothetical protein